MCIAQFNQLLCFVYNDDDDDDDDDVFCVGVLRNTEPLDYAVKHNFILEVKAEDCGGRLSNKLLVNIVVKPACQNGWKGIS